ncbi:MAG TPA: carboxyl transferase domain-containing protein [Acidimicrobiales bacterium]|nr:carboxyl transferase domain-containing protein [Acidimicrobiales bacterium]
MEWSEELEELRRREAFAAGLGGPEGVERQRRLGKLTVRERIARLADEGSFRPFGGLRGQATYADDGTLVSVVPIGEVDGRIRIDGRDAIVMGSDVTVRGGSLGEFGAQGTELSAAERALEWRLPYVRLLDSAGGSVRTFEQLGRTYLPDGNIRTQTDVRLLREVPVVAAVLGAVAGLPALEAVLAHFSVMTKRNAQVFPGGPPVVKAATGIEITKEDLGGPDIHVRESGVIDNLAEDEDDAFAQMRRFLSYMPSSVDELPSRCDAADPADRRDERLGDAVPHNPRRVFDARAIIRSVVDEGSFFEIAPLYGRARVTGLARIDGYPVGIMANDPLRLGGATDVAAGSKVVRLIQLCDTFHLPLVDLVDEPGLMVGIESERQGIERAGARLICAVVDSRMPYLVFILRRLYGVAGQSHHRPSGMYRRYAWPSASWGSMHILGGVAAAYRRDIESADDPDAKRTEIEARLTRIASPFRTAEATGQDIIDPRDTRPLAVEFVRDAQRVLARQLGASPAPYRP